jgi:Ca-activated chloride channel family protein
MKRALEMPRTAGFSRSVIVATDGLVTVETEIFDMIRKNLGDANMFTFGIGTSVNRYILEGMARAGMGEPFVITSEAEAPVQAEKFRKIVQTPVLTGIRLDFGKFNAYDVEPISIPDVMADRPVIVFGKWRGNPKGMITLKGKAGKKDYSESINVAKTGPAEGNSALKYLWARHRIMMLSDYSFLRQDDKKEKRVEEVTQLGLKYNLLTAYTSFVAIDSLVRNKEGESTTVNQPLPLPQGVSDYAVGRPAYAPASAPMYYKAKSGPHGGLAMAEKKDMVAGGRQEATSTAKAKVIIQSVEASDSALKEAVRKTATSNIADMQACNEGNLHGRIVVKLVIGADGRVKSATVISDRIKNAKLKKCLVDTMKKWQFDASASKADMTAKITLVF